MAGITPRVCRGHLGAVADHPSRARLAVSDRAGAAAVRGAEAAGSAGGDAAVSRRGTRTVPVRPAPAPGATVRGHPGLVGALLAGVTGPTIGRMKPEPPGR